MLLEQVSAFGATSAPTTDGADPVATADSLAAWVVEYGLDGVDVRRASLTTCTPISDALNQVDYEDFGAFNGGTTAGVDWLVSFTTELRAKLPSPDYIITHAPVGPWFEKGYTGGGYLAVDTAVGDLIDW